ncbi:hypothetical protein [Streptomyces brasiliensis]|uniref:Uncharacterized protein n=1 Tax=Streptomyces brasiliensis TaxID=1954 RepID=A0A917KZ67_9ACTN|nr:hypothetical protein [Streptomyces brasiliensis]GGJ34277.1 hypothetical protein GCM10010121_051910 [Streptomyces brasiliensis]
MGTDHPLARLIDEADLPGTYWNKEHGLFKKASSVDGLVDEAEILDLLDTGLVRRPYFMLLKEGRQPTAGDSRVQHHADGERAVAGFAGPDGIRALLAAGATMTPSRLEDRHAPLRAVLRQIKAGLPEPPVPGRCRPAGHAPRVDDPRAGPPRRGRGPAAGGGPR